MSSQKQFLVTISEEVLRGIKEQFGYEGDSLDAEHLVDIITDKANFVLYGTDMYRKVPPFSHLPLGVQQNLICLATHEESFASIIRAGLWVKEQQKRGYTIFVADAKGQAQTYDE